MSSVTIDITETTGRDSLPSPTAVSSCDHEWTEKIDVFRFPTHVYITVGSQVKIPLRLVKDETNDSIFFYIMEQPVWQSLYEYEMDENPSAQVSETNPVTNVGISDAKFFRDRFAVDIVPNTGLKFRLPTKEEWLLAARALPELKLGEQVDEVLSDGIVMSKGTNDEPPRPIAYYFGSRNVTGQPELKKNTNISSDRTGFRLVADRTVESAARDVDFNDQTALPSGQTVTTQPVTHTYKKYRRVLRFYHYNQCRKCGAVKSINE